MLKKIQLVINLDKSTQSHIFSKIRKLREDIDAKWVKPENYSIQLAMMRMVDDEYLYQLCETLQSKVNDLEAFDLDLDQVVWGPNEKTPKMLWLKGSQNEDLVRLRNNIEECLMENPREIKNFSPHITLAKVPQKSFSKEIDLEKIKMSVVLPVDSIDVVEIYQDGRKKRSTVLQSIELSY